MTILADTTHYKLSLGQYNVGCLEVEMVQSNILWQSYLQFSIIVIRMYTSDVASEEIISASILRPRHAVMQGKGLLLFMTFDKRILLIQKSPFLFIQSTCHRQSLMIKKDYL